MAKKQPAEIEMGDVPVKVFNGPVKGLKGAQIRFHHFVEHPLCIYGRIDPSEVGDPCFPQPDLFLIFRYLFPIMGIVEGSKGGIGLGQGILVE